MYCAGAFLGLTLSINTWPPLLNSVTVLLPTDFSLVSTPLLCSAALEFCSLAAASVRALSSSVGIEGGLGTSVESCDHDTMGKDNKAAHRMEVIFIGVNLIMRKSSIACTYHEHLYNGTI